MNPSASELLTKHLQRVGFDRTPDGKIIFATKAKVDRTGFKAIYCDSVIEFANGFEPAFKRASQTSQFEFVSLLTRMRGLEDPGWDPYESTKATLTYVREALASTKTFAAERTLQLWVYGHIVEASEPYEILMNITRIIRGERFHGYCFPPRPKRGPQSPGEKIRQIEQAAADAGVSELVLPLKQIWDRELRNAIFHSDYSLHGGEVRLRNPYRAYPHETIMELLNRALAFHDVLSALDKAFRAHFEAPILIPVHAEFAKWPDEKAWVMVREGTGAIGLHDALSPEERRQGKIPWHFGRFLKSEIDTLFADPTAILFPPEKEPGRPAGLAS
ncbi:MAG: hypothetical protein ABIR71_08615 [Chthoniobacterales bacterium]